MQNLVRKFNKKYASLKKAHMGPNARLFDIINQVGHLAGEFLKITNYNSKSFKSDCNFELELGDVFYSLFSLSNELGVDAGKALLLSLQKYKSRYFKNNPLANENQDKQIQESCVKSESSANNVGCIDKIVNKDCLENKSTCSFEKSKNVDINFNDVECAYKIFENVELDDDLLNKEKSIKTIINQKL